MTVDGALLAYSNKFLFNDSSSKLGATNFIMNLSIAILFLFLFAKAGTVLTQTIFSILSIFFLFCFIAFMTGDKYGETEPYYLYFLIVGLVSGIILCSLASIKNKLKVST
jgi:hypothetical protein